MRLRRCAERWGSIAADHSHERVASHGNGRPTKRFPRSAHREWFPRGSGSPTGVVPPREWPPTGGDPHGSGSPTGVVPPREWTPTGVDPHGSGSPTGVDPHGSGSLTGVVPLGWPPRSDLATDGGGRHGHVRSHFQLTRSVSSLR